MVTEVKPLQLEIGANTRHAGRNGDWRQTTAPTESSAANTRHTGRNSNWSQTTASTESIIADTRHTFRDYQVYYFGRLDKK